MHKHIINYGDILAIPFFALMIFYFYQIEDKNIIEWILFLFSISGFIIDILFTYLFIIYKN
jgi:peptidoglycan/LPS O-acetylase OafA/YrhL